MYRMDFSLCLSMCVCIFFFLAVCFILLFVSCARLSVDRFDFFFSLCEWVFFVVAQTDFVIVSLFFSDALARLLVIALCMLSLCVSLSVSLFFVHHPSSLSVQYFLGFRIFSISFTRQYVSIVFSTIQPPKYEWLYHQCINHWAFRVWSKI